MPRNCSEAIVSQKSPLLECYLNGLCVVRVEVVPSTLGSLTTAVDRVVFHAGNLGSGPAVVLDVVPGAPPIFPGGSSVTTNPARVDLDLRVRNLVMGNCGFARVSAALVAVQGGWRIASLAVDGQALVPAGGIACSGVTADILKKASPIVLTDVAPAPLWGALGLPARVPFGAIGRVSLTPTPASSSVWVPKLEYQFALRANEAAAIHLTDLQLQWTVEEIGVAGLVDQPIPDPNYLRLAGLAIQSLWIETDELNGPGSAPVGKWIVELTGFPSRAVVAAWNESVVVPYIRSLRTLQAGRPVTGLPWLTQVDYVDPSKSSQPPSTAGRDLGATLGCQLRWEIAVLVIDSVHGEYPLTDASFTVTSGFAPAGRLSMSLAWLRPMTPASGRAISQLPVIASLSGCLTHDAKAVVLSGWIQPISVNPSTTYGFAFDVRWFLTGTSPTDRSDPGADVDRCQRVRIGALDFVLPPSPADSKPLDATVLDPLFPPPLAPLWPNFYRRIEFMGRPPDLVYAVLPPFTNTGGTPAIPDATYRVGFGTIQAGPRRYPSAVAVNLTTTVPVLALAPGGQDARSDEELLGSAAPGEVNSVLGDSSLSGSFSREEPLLVGDHRPAIRTDLLPSLYLEITTQSQSTSSATVSVALKLNTRASVDIIAELSRNRNLFVIDRQPFFVGKLQVKLVPSTLDAEARELAFWDSVNSNGFRWRIRTDNPQFLLQLPSQGVGEQLEKTKGDIVDPSTGAQGTPINFRFSPCATLTVRASDKDSRFVVACWDLRRIFEGDESDSPQLNSAELELLYGVALRVRVPGLRVAETQLLQGDVPGEFPAQLQWNALNPQPLVYTQARTDWASTYGRLLSRLGILEPWLVANSPELTLTDPLNVRYQLRTTSQVKYPFTDVLPRGSNIPQGDLAGGFAWAFPFSSVYKQIWAKPVSDMGTLSSPYFSALGGWGHQKAQFWDGTITLIADTAMGRTSFYSLEIIGRIGVFWNRAKHVIIYQRTVAPSAQFAGEQDEQLGRPILRKVQEYVEILVPIAQFGDTGATDLERRARGCLLGIHFKTVRINIDSAWGGDVHDRNHVPIGYQIPLWNAAAKPEVYPLPHVLFEFASDPAAGFSSFLRDVVNVDKLRFFHSSRPGDGGDTDQWPSFEGIDFVLRSAPTSHGEGSDFTIKNGKPKLKDDMPFTPPAEIADGSDQFTWAVATDDVKAHLTIDRPGKVVSTVVKNILAARPIPATIPVYQGSDLVTSDVLRYGSQLVDMNQVPAFLGDLTASIANVRTIAGGPIGADLKDKVTLAVAQLQGRLSSAIDHVAPPYQNKLDSFRRWLRTGTLPVFSDVNKLLTNFTQSTPSPDACRQALQTAATQLAQGLSSGCGAVFQDFQLAQAALNDLSNRLSSYQRTQLAAWDGIGDSVNRLIADGVQDVGKLQSGASAILGQAITTAQAVSGAMQSLWARVGVNTPASITALQNAVAAAIDAFKTSMHTAIANVTSLNDLRPLTDGLNNSKTAFTNTLFPVGGGGPFAAAITDVTARLNTFTSNLATTVGGQQLPIPSFLGAIGSTWGQNALALMNAASDQRASAIDSLTKICTPGTLDGLVTAALAAAAPAIDLNTQLSNLLAPAVNDATKLADALRLPVGPLLDNLATNKFANAADVANFLNVLNNAQTQFPQAGNQLFANAAATLPGLLHLPSADAIANASDQALRLLRAFGDVPQVPALTFNADQLGYYFDAFQDVVDTTPVLSMISRPVPGLAEFAEDKLKALGVRLPTQGLLDGLVPSLDDFTPDLSDMFPDFAGLKLDKLFPSLAIPDDLKNNIKVSHGLDQQTLRAWLKVDVAFDSKGPTEIFSFGPLTLTVIDPHFEAHVSLSADANGHLVKTTTGLISADWDLNVASLDIVTLTKTKLTFDQSGRINVNINPANIRLNGLLQLISDAVDAASGDSDGGFSYQLVEDGGFPIGVQVLLDIVLPPIQEGTTGISNLRLTTAFEIVSAPEFALGVKFGLGLPEKPFTITVFILGGAGAIVIGARYLPFSGRLSADTSITLAASASLAVSFGPISGMVAIYLGFTAEFHRDLIGGDGRDNKLVLTAFIELLGEVDVLGIISVQIEVRLSLTYDPPVLTGTGSVSISVKICWCFSISVNVDISMSFGDSGGGIQSHQTRVSGPSRAALTRAARPATRTAAPPAPPPPNPTQAAAECVAMYDLS
jgi:hypothetical protein